jgi:CheY-like chemotaxis protein/HPt (histidine-containing phosphotransfer) domain-containing protein
MPDVDGFTLCRRITEDDSLGSTIIMMLSSFDRDADVARCNDLGVDAYLVKPIKQSDLFDAIARSLGAHGVEGASHRAITEMLPFVRPLKLLLAEDSLANQQLAVGLLSRWGHSLDVVDNGREAVSAIQNGQFDAVLMDVQMPELDGLQATRAIREWEVTRGTRIPIIAMTAHAMKGDRERCLDSGMDAYVSKPIRPHDIAEALARFFPTQDGVAPAPVAASAASSAAPAESEATAVNWQLALIATQGDHGLLREVAEVCAAELPMLRRNLAEAVERGETAEVMRLAHTIKGNLRTFGGCGIRYAEQLEQAGKRGDLQSASGLLQALGDDVSRVEQALNDYLQRQIAQSHSAGDSP